MRMTALCGDPDLVLAPSPATADAEIELLMVRLETNQPDSRRHAAAVESMSVAAADALGLPGDNHAALRLGAHLHDIGKLFIPRTTLTKQGPLTSAEWAMMRRHPVLGVSLLSSFIRSELALAIVLSHHERWDGAGYPNGVEATTLPVPVRIVAVADAYQAMTEQRTYKRPLSSEAAVCELRKNAGTQFDPSCVEAFCDVLARRAA
jgi:putative two-component system response regulator